MTALVPNTGTDPSLGGIALLLRLFDQAGVTREALPDIGNITLYTRPMNEDEKRGYVYALDVMQTWAAQLEAAACKLSDDAADAATRTPRQLCIERVRMVGDLARAQQLGFLRG